MYLSFLYISYYFLCSPLGQGVQALTEAEARRGLVAEWQPVTEMLALFARHEEYAAESEPKRGSYQREYTALSQFQQTEVLP